MILRGNPLLKRADRWIGVPLVVALRRWRRRAIPRRLDTVGLLKTNAIGDTVLLSGVVQDLRTAHPHAKLVLVVGPSNRAIAHLIPGVDWVVELPIHRPDRAARILRSHHLDALLDFGSWPRVNALLTRLSGARFTAGFKTAGQHRHHVFDAVVAHSALDHEMDNYRRLSRVLGARGGATPRLLPPEDSPVPWIDEPFVILHPWPGGTRRELKQWPANRWRQLAVHFARQDLRVVFTGGPDDELGARELVDSCAAGARVTSVAGELTVAEVGTLLTRSRFVVSVNTGVMHMAAALGAPLVALHGPTNPKRWGPLSDRAVSVVSEAQGCGYLNLGFEYPDDPPRCMEAISVEAVLDAVDELLDLQIDRIDQK